MQARILVGRNIKTARGRLWIVCAACVTDFQALPSEACTEPFDKACILDVHLTNTNSS